MRKKYSPLFISGVNTYSVLERKSKVSVSDFATPWKKGESFNNFLNYLPDILCGKDIREVISAVSLAAEKNKTVFLGMGAHVIKVGLNPVIIDLMERKIVTALALNGACIIHDFELAFTGRTSEDVAASLGDGSFGMARETCSFLGEAIKKSGERQMGLGESVGYSINKEELPHRDKSIVATAQRLGIPVTVHIAMGTDIIHMHPEFDPREAGAASHRDFRLFAGVVTTLEGGVYMNIGSAVILPEVFLKAITLARNLGHKIDNFTTVNMDFIKQYRPLTNVVNRPTAKGGKGYNLTGHHELLLPVIAAGVIEEMKDARG